jgi:hypothetical protein
MNVSRTAPATERRADGPPLGALALASTGVFVGSLVATAVLTGGQVFVSPFADATTISAYYVENGFAARVSGMLQFGAAVPFGILAATLYARLGQLGVRVPGPGIGFFGGIVASAFLMLSGLLTWVLGQEPVAADAGIAQSLLLLSFACGGVGYVVGSGLLVAGVAVPALILRFIPRWIAWTGLVIAAISELSFLSLVFDPLQYLLPLGRFGGLAWLIVVGFLLPRTRAAANRVRPVDRGTGG